MSKTQIPVDVTKNSFKDEGEGVVTFNPALVITDSTVQRNGTKYDIDSLDLSKYAGQLTADHEDKLQNVIGRVEGLKKENGKVTIDRIVYAINSNTYARIAYNLLTQGFSGAFSIETLGGSPDPNDGMYYKHEMVGLSQVVVPNNYSATVNQIVKNSIDEAQKAGLEINQEVEELVTEKGEEMTEDEVKNTEVEATEVQEDVKEEVDTEKVENTEQEEVETKVENVENEVSDKVVEDLTEAVKELIALEKKKLEGDTEDPVKGLEEIAEENSAETKKEEIEMTRDELRQEMNAVLEGFVKNMATQNAQEPTIQGEAKAGEETDKTINSIAKMDWRERYQIQVNSIWEALNSSNLRAYDRLREINEFNLNELKDAGIARNSMTITSMGNFVMPPEMYKKIVGSQSDYSSLLEATEWRETQSLEFAWIRRKGAIDMKNVVMCDDGNDGNLKPKSEYTAEHKVEKLEEVAAVTPVCTAATRFFAVDLLEDVAKQYRQDYDRKRAQLVIAKLQQATTEANSSIMYSGKTDTDAMISWLDVIAKISDSGVQGTLIFNARTFAKLKSHALKAGINGPLGDIFVTGEVPTIFGTPYIIVPNDLMPSIESTEDVKHTLATGQVKIECAAFYADLSEFVGYTSGGLQYTMSNQASYTDGNKQKSAYERNELVLRGSFYRGGAFHDIARVAGIKADQSTVLNG